MAWLRARVAELEEVNARLREAARDRDELGAAQLAARDAQIAALAAQVEELRRRLDKDSSTSSRPPSSDSPYKKKPRDRSLRGRSGRRPGKQPGAESSTLRQSPDPGETVLCGPAACGCCGHGLAGEPVLGAVQKRQVFEASPPPPPSVTEYQVTAKRCPECGEVSVGLAPAGVTGRAQYGPLVHARTALAVCANYLPVARAARLVAALTGVNVSAGFAAGIRGKAARLCAPFTDRVRELLPAARRALRRRDPRPGGGEAALRPRGVHRVPHRDAHRRPDQRGDRLRRDPARLRGHDRPRRLQGIRAPHRCAARLVRRPRAARPGRAAPLRPRGPGLGAVHGRPPHRRERRRPAPPARGPARLSDAGLGAIRAWYRGAVAKGMADNQGKRTQIALDGARLARRFRDHEDMILRFATDLAVGFTSNQAERDVRPVKVQQRTSGGTWRTLRGLADFAVVQSCLSTTAKWGIDALDALTMLFTDGPWLPPAATPP